MTGENDDADKIKIGFYEEEDGTFTTFLRMQKLPEQDSAVEAAEWLADVMTNLTSPPEEEQN